MEKSMSYMTLSTYPSPKKEPPMKKLSHILTITFGLSLLTSLGLVIAGLTFMPAKAEAGCSYRWKRSWRCVTRYGRRHCSWQSTRKYICTGRYGTYTTSYRRSGSSYRRRCVWRTYRKRYCTRSRGRYVMRQKCWGFSGHWRCPYRRVYVPGRYHCTYRNYRRKVCY